VGERVCVCYEKKKTENERVRESYGEERILEEKLCGEGELG
jgi:hypothetical protein